MEDFESLKMKLFLQNIPCYIFWKDRNLAYQGGNDYFLEGVGVNSVEEVKGKTDYDFPWAYTAQPYRESDLLVLEGKSVLNSKEYRWYQNEFHLMIINKIPLKDEKENIIGVLGIHQDIGRYLEHPKIEQPNTNLLSSTELVQKSEIELFSTLKNALGIPLTHREIECLSLWLSGYSIKESSYCLNLSEKSIEAYRKHIKDKMGVYHKYQVIDLMQAKDTFHLFLALAKLIQQKSKRSLN